MAAVVTGNDSTGPRDSRKLPQNVDHVISALHFANKTKLEINFSHLHFGELPHAAGQRVKIIERALA